MLSAATVLLCEAAFFTMSWHIEPNKDLKEEVENCLFIHTSVWLMQMREPLLSCDRNALAHKHKAHSFHFCHITFDLLLGLLLVIHRILC